MLFARAIRSLATKPRNTSKLARSSSTKQTSEYFVWPREREGDIIRVNWSLVEDGVTNTKEAFLHADKRLLTKHAETSTPAALQGARKIHEAGASIAHDDFAELFKDTTTYLSSGHSLFIEDHNVGSHRENHLGVRVITDLPHVALAFRQLLMATPHRQVDMRARARGWNLDKRWAQQFPQHNLETGEPLAEPHPPQEGQRPIVVYVGGDAVSKSTALQFLQFQEKIVGANIVAGKDVAISTIAHAIGFSATVIANAASRSPALVALRDSSVFTSNSIGKTVLLVTGADNNTATTLAEALASNAYSMNYSALIAEGAAAAVMNGFIGAHAIIESPPDNLAFPVTAVLFIGESNAAVAREDAVKRLAALAEGLSVEQAEERLKTVLKEKVSFQTVTAATVKDAVLKHLQ